MSHPGLRPQSAAPAWPGGARCAIAFTFDFDAEEVWIAEDPSNAERPVALSQGTYGAKVGMPAILDLLEKHETRATFFVPGRVAESHEWWIGWLVKVGHELACHGYTHRPPAELDPEEEERELVKAEEVLGSFGAPVIGYRAPAWDLSTRTIGLLERHGFRYSSNFMDDVRPYVHEGSSVAELPVHWALDDAAHWWFDASSWDKKISTTAEVRSIWQEELLGIRQMGGCCVFRMHPQVIGRPSRLAFLDEMLGWVRGLDDVWVATCAEIATVVRR